MPANDPEQTKRDSVDMALGMLDPDNDEHWTKAGLPQLAALSSVVGFDVDRAMLNAVKPGWDRVQARMARTANDGNADQTKARGAGASAHEVSNRQAEGAGRPDDRGRSDPVGVGGGAAGGAPSEARRVPTAGEIARSLGNDAILIMEAFCVAAATERFKRNGPIQQAVRLWQNEGAAAKERQRMLDKSMADRAARRAARGE